MATIHLATDGQRFIKVECPKITSGDKNVDYLRVDFCPAWDGFGKTAIFYRNENEVYYAVIEDNMCVIPWEVLQTEGVLYLGIFGSKDEIRKTSEIISYKIYKGAFIEDTIPSDPTPNIYDQIVAAYGVNSALINSVKKEIAVERARIDNLSKLGDGSTTGDAELQDIRNGWDGTVYGLAGNAVRAIGMLAGSLPQVRVVNDSAEYSRKTSQLVQDGFYSITASLWDDLPCGNCVLVVMRYSVSYVVQLAIEMGNGAIYSRIVNRSTYAVFSDWKSTLAKNGGSVGSGAVKYYTDNTSGSLAFHNSGSANGGAGIWLYGVDHSNKSTCRIQVFDKDKNTYRKFDIRANGTVEWNGYNIPTTMATLNAADYEKKTARITNPGYYSISASEWDDVPFKSCVLMVFQFNDAYVVQVAIPTVYNGVYTRIVHRTNYTVYRDWASPDGMPPVKVLALGDSICAGYRNSGKGFVGDLGLNYKNIGISGASLSNVTKTDKVIPIPDQLVNLTGYEPDIIISDGGVNDYFYNAPMGEVPNSVIATDEGADALDRNTTMGGIQYLFYTMITKYPKAQRFFLLTHKTTANLNGKICDWSITKNTAGYTQAELFDAIRKVCDMYSVKIIDVYAESMINTAFDVYKSDVLYNDDESVTDTEFVDADGIHPLAYGYLHGYVPIIKQALQISTSK